MMLFNFLVLLWLCMRAVYCACPTGWAVRGQTCYTILGEKVRWSQANALCGLHSGRLVSLFGKDEWNFLSGLVKDSSYQETGVWFGIHLINGKWFWYDSVKSFDAFGDWDSPNGSPPQSYQYDFYGKMSNPSGEKVVMAGERGANLLHPFCKRSFDARDECDYSHGWTLLYGKCYKMFPAQTRDNALETCSMYSSELALPTIKHDLTVLRELTKGKQEIWVDATRNMTKKGNTFVGKDGKSVTLLPWLSDPHGITNRDVTERCLALTRLPDSNDVFYSEDCSVEMAFVCIGKQGSCPLGWHSDHSGQCYHWYARPHQQVTWSQAVNVCHQQGAQLVQPGTRSQQKTFLSEVLQDNDVQSVWYGIKGGEQGYLSLDNKMVIPKVMTFDTEEGLGDLDKCGVTDFDPKRTIPSADYCYLTKPFVCSIPRLSILLQPPEATSHCDAGWTLYTDHCLQLITLPSRYKDAEDECRANGGASLMTITNQLEQSFFSTSVFKDYSVEMFWIGVRYDSNYIVDTGFSTKIGAYVYGNGNQVIFSNMAKPNSTLIKWKQCIVVKTGVLAPFPGLWQPEDCDVLHPFVCQKNAIAWSVATVPAKRLSWSPYCGPGWVYSDKTASCYWVERYMYRTWTDARSACQDKSADLLSVVSGPEQQIIAETLTHPEFNNVMDPLWTGGSDKGDNYGWIWSDGSPFAYFTWGEAQPAYGDADGDNCVTIPVNGNNFRWEAHACGQELPYICKKRAMSKQSTDQPTTDGSVSKKCVQEALISGEHPVQNPLAFSASSSLDELHSPLHSRLLPNNQGFWRPSHDTNNQWIQVTFASTVTVTSILLKGNTDLLPLYVTKFKVQYRYDDSSPWYWIERGGTEMILDGVKTPGKTMSVFLPEKIEAMSIRVWPVQWENGIAVQFDIVGCRTDSCTPEYAVSGPLVVRDDQIVTSSGIGLPWRGRMRSMREGTPPIPWLSSEGDVRPWIKVDLGHTRIIRGLTLRSGFIPGKYTHQFKLLFSDIPTDDLTLMSTYQQPFGSPYVFDALSDQVTTKTIILPSSVQARTVALLVTNVTGSTNLFMDVLVCPVGCRATPMLTNLDSVLSLSASLTSDPSHSPAQSRMLNQSAGWKPGPNVKAYESYIQADLETVVQVRSVSTRGSQGSWVRSYTLAFSTDGAQWEPYNASMVFKANFDDWTEVKNELAKPLNARYVRLYPVDFKNEISLKWEVYACAKLSSQNATVGCYGDEADEPDLPYSALAKNDVTITPDVCISHCYNKGYHYAGIEDGSECGCGNTYGLYGPSDQCDKTCGSSPDLDLDLNVTCGGSQDNTVFRTGIGPKSLVCPTGWAEFEDFCYFVDKSEETTWFGAKRACEDMTSHLVDIRSKGENDFVVSLLASKGIVTSWLGLNDNVQSLHFRWSSGDEDVGHTQWDHHQPVFNPGLEQHGVVIRTSTEGWSNVFSESYHNYVCKTGKRPSQTPLEDVEDSGCDKGWYGFQDKCFQLNPLKQTWDGAVYLCNLGGSAIATVLDGSENAFLTSRLGFLSGVYWIGIAMDKDTGQFVDKVKVKGLLFTNWDRYNPVPTTPAKCVGLHTTLRAGQWANLPCVQNHHFICQKPRKGLPTIPSPSLPTSGFCPNGWLEFTSACYQIYESSPTTRLTWFESLEKCKELGASLASVHSNDDLEALHLHRKHEERGNLWIGLNNFDENSGYEWADDSVMDFIAWGHGQPSNERPAVRTCGEINTRSRSFSLQECSSLQGFVCSFPRGQKLKPVPKVVFPTPQPVPQGATGCSSRSPSDRWVMYGDYCYHFGDGSGGTGASLTWREGRKWCDDHGGHLTSITSLDENRFIQGMALRTMSSASTALWIGLNQLNRDRVYSWTDGSPTGLWALNWNVNEPDDKDGFEACVAMVTRNGKWDDQHCSKRQGFVCKKSAYPNTKPPSVPAPTLRGNCPAGFHHFRSKCYRLYGVVKGELRLPWTQARKACQGLGDKYTRPDLVSITSGLENAFVMSLLRPSKSSAWIGLRRPSSPEGYSWTDERDLTYENWNRDEPNAPADKASCVYMYGPTLYAGRWNDVDCDMELAPYICQTLVDEKLPAVLPLPSVHCNIGLGYHSSGEACLKVVDTPTSWTMARQDCRQDGAYLTWVQDAYDVARTLVESSSSSSGGSGVGGGGGGDSGKGEDGGVWMGLTDRQTRGVYKWDNGYPVSYTPWTHHQPVDTPTHHNCVFLDQQHGMFDKADCDRQNKSYICQMNTAPPNDIPASVSESCPDKDFQLIGTRCFSVTFGVPDGALTYEGARQACRDNGAELASVLNTTEYFSLLPGMILWIGLRDSLDGGYRWEDGSPLAFTQWAQGQPERSRTTLEGSEDGCVVVDSSQSWSSRDCLDKLGYICVKNKANPILPSYYTLPTIPPHTMRTPRTAPHDLPPHTPVPPSPSTIGQRTPHENRLPTPSSSSSLFSSSSSSLSSQGPHNTSPKTHHNNGTQLQAGSGDSSSLSTGEMAGLVVGVLLAMTLIIVGALAYWKREHLKRSFLGREFSKGNFESRLYTETHEDELSTRDDGGAGVGGSGNGSVSVSIALEQTGGTGSGSTTNVFLQHRALSSSSSSGVDATEMVGQRINGLGLGGGGGNDGAGGGGSVGYGAAGSGGGGGGDFDASRGFQILGHQEETFS